MNYIQVPCSES